MQAFYYYAFTTALLITIRACRYLNRCRMLRGFIFLKRLNHLQNWQNEARATAVGSANVFARDYAFEELYAHWPEFRAHVKRHHGGDFFSFRLHVLSLGYDVSRNNKD